MPSKRNPKNLNPLQLRTLVLFQQMARSWGEDDPNLPGAKVIRKLPHAHGNHFHIGDAVVMSKDATGLGNQAVWVALERKGMLATVAPDAIAVTPEGLDYDTGVSDQVLHRADH